MTRHFDFLCSAVESAIGNFEEGRRDGDHGFLHIDDLNALRGVLRGAYDLCDATEGTVFTDEFGDHYVVPKAEWDALAAAMRGEPAPAEMSASSPSEASAGNLPQDEPNYKALYTELKGEVLEKVGVIGRLARSNDGSRTFDDCIRDLMLIDDQCRALSTLYDKLSSIEEFPELPSGDVKNAAGEAEGSGAGVLLDDPDLSDPNFGVWPIPEDAGDAP